MKDEAATAPEDGGSRQPKPDDAAAQPLLDLIAHMKLHDGYPRNGYSQMTTPQKALFDAIAYDEDGVARIAGAPLEAVAAGPAAIIPLADQLGELVTRDDVEDYEWEDAQGGVLPALFDALLRAGLATPCHCEAEKPHAHDCKLMASLAKVRAAERSGQTLYLTLAIKVLTAANNTGSSVFVTPNE